jgi:hypothetical protein
MQSLKPTTIIALDAHAAAFCVAARARLKREYGTARDSLIQAYLLVVEEASIRFEPNLETVADSSFDLEAARANTPRPRPPEVAELFRRQSLTIEEELAGMLTVGRRAKEMDEALREGIEIVDESTVFLVMSASDPTASGVVLELYRALKKVLSIRFAGDLYTLHAVVLLPDLFLNPASQDFAASYALLKKLDHAALNGISITPHRTLPSFESCWLIDGRNARGTRLGTLAEELGSYADAFVGFLTADPERSGAAPGSNPRGRPPAYNSFGYGELFFPAEIAITRLSAALASDIITRAFLGGESAARAPANERRLLLAAKQFVLGKSYSETLEGLERDKGAMIWRDFGLGVAVATRPETREIDAREHVAELQRRHAEYDRKEMLEFRKTLLARTEEVRGELVKLLDDECDQRCDASTDGLHEALRFLTVMTDPAIAIQEDLLGEDPQNLITERRAAEAVLDRRLGVVFNRQETTALLEQVNELRANLQSLQTSLRLAPQPAGSPAGAQTGASVNTSDQQSSAPDAEADAANKAAQASTSNSISPEEDRRQLLAELETNERQLQALKAEYPRVLERENRAADLLRREARKTVTEEKERVVAELETQLVSLGDQLQAARRVLHELKEERRLYLHRMIKVYPTLTAMVLFGVPAVAALFDLGPARDLVAFFWDNLWRFLLWIAIAFAVYAGFVYLILTRDINRRIKEASALVDSLSNSLHATAAHLRNAHNDVLRFEYEQFAQRIRTETLDHLLETARRRIEELNRTITSLREISEGFTRQRIEADSQVSIMRRPLLTAADIDAYYQRTVNDLEPTAATFTQEWVARSQARRIDAAEFRARLMQFTRKRFDWLAKLSIEDALLRQHDLIPADTALARLRDLNKTAEPLLRLRDAESSQEMFAERDSTLWASGDGRDQILSLYQRISPKATVRASDNGRTLRVLTRCHNFPAYFLGSIEHYRACYEREPEKDAAEYPDCIPLDPAIKRTHEMLLLSLALGLVARRPEGDYFHASDPTTSLGNDRHAIAENLATSFEAKKLHDELQAQIKNATTDHAVVHGKLLEYLNANADLDASEREILLELAQQYHPLH